MFPNAKPGPGRTTFTYLDLPVQAGSVATIDAGDVCKLISTTFASSPIVTASANDTDFIPLIACQDQGASDAARKIRFILPLPGDLFEYSCASAAITLGAALGLTGAQAFDVDATNVMGHAVAECLEDGSWPTVTKTWVSFNVMPEDHAISGLNPFVAFSEPNNKITESEVTGE